jgi:UPF0176 protein
MQYQIITFYEFKDLGSVAELTQIKASLIAAMQEHSTLGTIILADEGFNSTVGGRPDDIERFIAAAERILETRLRVKSSFHSDLPFRRIKVKIKREIVTLKKSVDIKNGNGTHVDPKDWNAVISDPDVILIDTRNEYEFRNGTFVNALNPATKSFSELPEFIAENLDPNRHKKVAMFCTGGIRCEKFVPYMKDLGFDEVYQLEGGILKYLEEIPKEESLWQGECFVFDDRVTVDEKLEKGSGPDYSQM